MKRNERSRDLSQQIMTLMRTRLRAPVSMILLTTGLTWTMPSYGLTLIKSNSVGNSILNVPTVIPNTSYVQNVGPTADDTILFNNTITGGITYRVSNVNNSVLNVGSMQVGNPNGQVTIQNADNQNQVINLGSAGVSSPGLDLSRATNNLAITNTSTTNGILLNLLTSNAATWAVNTGRTLTVSSQVNSNFGLNVQPGLHGLGGTVVLGSAMGANTISGATSVTGSSLTLDYTHASNRIDTASALNLTRSTLTVQGGTTFTQATNGLNLGVGLNTVNFGGSTVNLNVGAINRTSNAGLLNVGTAGRMVTSSSNTNGILGGWAVVNRADWAVAGASGAAITAITAYTDKGGAWTAPLATENVRITAAATGVTSGTVNSIKLNGAFNLTQNAGTTLNIASGGLLKNDNGASTISGGSLTAGGAANGGADDLYIWHQQNTLAIASNFVNNGADVLNLVKAGDATLRFDNTVAHGMTGTLTILGGRVLIGNNNTAGTLPGSDVVFGVSTGSSQPNNEGMLTYNRTDAGTWTQNLTGVGGDDGTRYALAKAVGTTGLTLQPTVANTYYGGTLISAGQLIAGNENALSPNSRVHFANVAQVALNLNTFNSTVRGLVGGGTTGGNVILGTANLTLQTLAIDSSSYAGVIDGDGGLIKNGAGTQTFTAGQTFRGQLMVNDGSLIATTLTPGGVVVNGGLLQATTVTNAGSLVANGGIFRASLVTGNTSLTANNNGRIELGSASSLPADIEVQLNGERSTLLLPNGASPSVGSLVLATGSQLAVATGAANSTLTFNDVNNVTWNGVIGTSGILGAGKVNLVKQGSSKWTLNSGHTFNGSLAVNSGSLEIASGANVEVIPDATSLILADNAGVELNVNGKTEVIGSLAGGGLVGGNVLLGTNGHLIMGGNHDSTNYAGVFSGSGTVTKEGSGTLTLTNNQTFTGTLNLNKGNLVLDKAGGELLHNGLSLNLNSRGSGLTLNQNETIGRLNATQNSLLTIPAGVTLTTNHAAQADIVLTGTKIRTNSRVAVVSSTSNLKVGMVIAPEDGGSDFPGGAYIVQILSGTQVLLNREPNATRTATFVFKSVDEQGANLAGGGDWVKKGAGSILISGNSTNFNGSMTIEDGSVIAGGFSKNGRTFIQDTIGDQVKLKLGVNGVVGLPSLSFTNSTTNNLVPFERIGSLEGESSAIVTLSSLSSTAALALGGNNQSTTYSGTFRGGVGTMLIKEGTGSFTWLNGDSTSMEGTIAVVRGTLNIGGANGLRDTNTVILSNASDANLIMSSSELTGEALQTLSGAGKGALRTFPNGTFGATTGNYLVGNGGNLTLEASRLALSGGGNYTFGGNIGGVEGGLVKTGNGTLELLGTNTYGGDTVVRSVAANTTSTIRLGAYSASAGVGTPSLQGGYGSLPSTGILEILAGASGVGLNSNAHFDLNGATQTLKGLAAREQSGYKLLTINGGVININNTDANTYNDDFAGILSGRGTINVQSTEQNGWVIGAVIRSEDIGANLPELNTNKDHRGELNIYGGKVLLSYNAGGLGDQVHVSIGSAGTLDVFRNDTIGSLTGSGTLFLTSASHGLTISSGPKGSIRDAVWSGSTSPTANISTPGFLTLSGRAHMTTRSNQGYTGLTTVEGQSNYVLDYSTGATDIIPAHLRLAGARLVLQGGTGGVETVSSTQIGPGVNSIIRGTEGTNLINLQSIRRGPTFSGVQPGGVLQVHGDFVQTLTANDMMGREPELGSIGILGGYATYGNGPNITTWAKASEAGTLTNIAPLLDTSFTTVNSSNPVAIGSHSDVKGSFTFGSNTFSLRFNTPVAAPGAIVGTLSGGVNESRVIESGGILVTRNVGNKTVRLTGGSNFLTAGSGELVANELIIHQHNTLGALEIEAPIVNNSNNLFVLDLSLTKVGAGRLILSSNNSYSGQTSILDGVVQLGDGAGGPAGTFGSSNLILNNALIDLRQGVRGSPVVYPEITGVGAIRVQSAAVHLLSGTNSTYTGPLSIVSGTVQVDSFNSAGGSGLGTNFGLTSVAGSGNLLLGGTSARVREPISLRGGTLGLLSGTVTTLAPLWISETSTLNTGSAGSGSLALTLNGPVIMKPNTVLNVTGDSGSLVFNSPNSVLGNINTSAPIIVGNSNLSSSSAGNLGGGSINLSGGDNLTMNVNDGVFALVNSISGSGGLVLNRNTTFLMGNNTYSGPTQVGSNNVGGASNTSAELRVAGDTFQGNLGTGTLTVQSSTGSESRVRFQSLANMDVTGRIILNPWSNGSTTAVNASLVRNGLGTVNLNGNVTAGAHSLAGQNPFTQRAFIIVDNGGKLALNHTITNSSTSRLNFQTINNVILEFGGSSSNTLWGRIQPNSPSDNTTSNVVFNNSGTTTLKSYVNFAPNGGTNRFNLVHIERGTLVTDHLYADDPDSNNLAQNPDAIHDDADLFLYNGSTLRINNTITAADGSLVGETIGSIFAAKGSSIIIPTGRRLTLDDSGNHVLRANITADGILDLNSKPSAIDATQSGDAWYALLGNNSISNAPLIGSNLRNVSVRVNDLTPSGSFGAVPKVILGQAAALGQSPQDVRLEYFNSQRLPQITNLDFDLSNSDVFETKQVSLTAGAGSFVVRVNDIGNLEVNMIVNGTNISPGTYISSINVATNEITLTQPTAGTLVVSSPLTFETVLAPSGAPINSSIRFAANGVAPLIVGTNSSSSSSGNGKFTVTNLGNKTLILHGQNNEANTINGMLDQAGSQLSLTVNPNVGNDDRYGTGRWVLSNTNNNFSGRITVNMGTLELAGDLGTGSSTTGIMGNLTTNRFIDLGSTNFDGRRYDIFGGGDNLGGVASTGTLLFNDPIAGTLTLGSNVQFNQSYTSQGGNGEIINNGAKVLVLNGDFNASAYNLQGTGLDSSVGISGGRSWILDGSNTGANTINGIIKDGNGVSVGLIKEGAGKWIINNAANTMTGAVTVSRGELQVIGGNSIGDNATVNVSNAGSDGTALNSAVLRIMNSETIGGLQGSIGSQAYIESGTLTVQAGNQTFQGILKGDGGFTRTNNDANARVSTLSNLNEYLGATKILALSSDPRGNRIDVTTLANGGVPSSIGKSTSDATNLVINTVNANGGLRFIGLESNSTDRSMVLGAHASSTVTAAPAAIWADGVVQGGVVPTVSFTSSAPVQFTDANLNSTLMLRGGNLGNNTFNLQVTDNGTGVVNLTKVEQGNWVLGGTNSFTGQVNIYAGVGSSSTGQTTGGALIITNDNALGTSAGGVNIGLFPGSANSGAALGTGVLLRGGRTIAGETLTGNHSGGTLHADSGVNTWNGNIALAGTNARFLLGSAEGATLSLPAPITGSVGTERLYISDLGTKVLGGSNTYTGITAITGGTVRLDFSTNNTSKFADASALELGWKDNGNVLLLGADADVPSTSYLAGMNGAQLELLGGSHIEIVNGLTLAQGANAITQSLGSLATLQAGSLARAVGGGVADYGTLNLSGGTIAFTNSSNVGTGANAILNNYTTIGGTHWAVRSDNATIGTAGAVASDATTDRITAANMQNGNIVRFTANAPAGLTVGTPYYIVGATATNFQVSTTLGGAPLDITANGTTATLVSNAMLGTPAAISSDAATDRIAIPNLQNGTLIRFTAGAPTGLSNNTDYFVINATATDFQVATALNGSAVNFSGTSTTGTIIRTGAINVVANNAYNNNTAATAFGSGFNTDVLTSLTQAAATTQTVRFNQAANTTLTLSGTLALSEGAILVTPNAGPVTITGAAIQRFANTVNLDTIIHHHGSNNLTIASVIQNNTNAQGLTKTGPGTLVLTGANTYTGRISIQQGILQVGDGVNTSATSVLSGGTSTGISLSSGAELRYNVANSALIYDAGAISGGGTLRLASTNAATFLMNEDSGNFIGDIIVEGGKLRVGGNNAASILGNLRGITTVNAGATLELFGATTATSGTITPLQEWVTFNDGSVFSAVANGSTNTALTMTGRMTLNNTTPAGFTINFADNQAATWSGYVHGTAGFTKAGNGVLTLSGNNFIGALDGQTGAGKTATLSGKILVVGGELRVGNARALGATGADNEVVVSSGASVDLRGNSLNYGDDASLSRKIFQIQGTGFANRGALKNSTGTGTVSHIELLGSATLNGGGFLNGSRLDVAGFDTNPNNGSGLDGNFTRNNASIAGNGFQLTITGGTQSGGVVLRQPNFTSAVSKILVAEGNLRLEMEIPLNGADVWEGLSTAQATQGIEIGYAGATPGDLSGANAGQNPNVGARLNFYRNMNVHHTLPIKMDGVTAATNGGANYIDMGNDTLPNPRTYLDGNITLLGDASRNIFHIDASSNNNSVTEQGNLTGAIQAKLIVGGQIIGDGGFTKTGSRELRLTNDNTYTGATNILRSGTSGLAWQSNTMTVNGVEYQTFGDAEGWQEWGLTLAGSNARLSGTSAINLQRKGMITLDNTDRLDATSGVTGGNHDDRINNAASINMNHGWLRIMGGSDMNSEAIATTGGSAVRIQSGTNLIDLWPKDGAAQPMTLTIGRLERSVGGVLKINNLDATSTFGSASPVAGVDTVRVAISDVSGLGQIGLSSLQTNRSIVLGVLGGNMPHSFLADLRDIGYNNSNVSDLFNQARNLQFATGSHFMTMDGGYIRPLDDSEYYTPIGGIIDSNAGASHNVNIADLNTIMRTPVMAVNSLRFGALADHKGDNLSSTLHSDTRLTSYDDVFNHTLLVDGRLNVTSGMISSSYFRVGHATTGNNSTVETLIIGGALDFGAREAVINNSNAVIRVNDGTVQYGNFQIRSDIMGTGGLSKTGPAQVVLDGYNTYSGVTTISDGTLLARNGRSALGVGGDGNYVQIIGNGSLQTSSGLIMGTAAARKDIRVGALQGDSTVFNAQNDLSYLYGNIIVDNVDLAGQVLFTPRLQATGGNAITIVDGNIVGGDTAVTNDVVASDARILSTAGSANSFIMIRGQLGDKLVNGLPAPVSGVVSALPTGTILTQGPAAGLTATNENEVMRFTIAGNNDLNVTLEKQTAAAGRLTLDQGVMYVSYNPSAIGNDGTGFYTSTALSRIAGRNANSDWATNANTSMHGFSLNSGSGNTALFLGQPGANGISGQVFNLAAWTIGANNTTYVGGINESGKVTYGDGTGSLILNKQVRFYSMAGGEVDMNMRLQGNQLVVKTGRGTMNLLNSVRDNPTADDGGSDTGSFELAGGKFVIDHAGQNVARFGNAGNFTFSGGTMVVKANAGAATSVNYANEGNGVRTVSFSGGGNEIIAETVNTGTARNMTLSFGNGNTTSNIPVLARTSGATANFVENQLAGGTAAININFFNSSVAAKNRIMSWATYGNQARTAIDFAMINGNSGPGIEAYNRAPEEYQNNVTQWTTGMDVSENGGNGFFGTLASSLMVNTIRFDTAAGSILNLGGNQLSISGDGVGAILVSSNTGNANKTIANGTLSTGIGFTGDPNFNKTFTGRTTLNLDVIDNLSSVTGLVVGMPISGATIPAGAIITGINAVANSITISAVALGSASSESLTTNDADNLIRNVSSTAGMVVGMYVTGSGIPANTTITAISGNTLTISANASTGSGVSLIAGYSNELAIHHYGQGVLDVMSAITGAGSLTISGPSTTNTPDFNTTGVVKLTGANSYTGRTYLSGGVLEIASSSALGSNPGSANNAQITMNGGTLRWAGGTESLGNRGFTLQGNGGVIDVVRSDGNLIIGSALSGSQAGITSQDQFRGDLVKTGSGTLTFMGSGTGHNSGFQGLLDIREGALVVMVDTGGGGVGTMSMFGSNRSWADGTIFRPGTNLQLVLGNGNNSGEWGLEEFMTFEGGNTITYNTLTDVTGDVSGNLDGHLNLGNRRLINVNGVMRFDGTTTLDVGFGGIMRLATNAGYITGSGDLIKDGLGQVEFRSNSPEWKGGLTIKQGTVYAISAADMLGTGYSSGKTITLGDASRQGTAQLLIQNPDGIQGWVFDVKHDINVVYNPAQTKRLGVDNISNSSRVSYDGNITLNDNLIVLLQDGGISLGGEQTILNFNGSFRDGLTTSGNLVIQASDAGGANDNVNGRMAGYAVFNGNNSSWTGDAIISTNTGYDHDKTAVLRMGHDQALTAANDVIMNYNSILQAGGRNVTIGSLITNGGTGQFHGIAGTVFASSNGSSEIIENASLAPGSFTISQTTPSTHEAIWDAKFRDGVPNSFFFAPGTNTHLTGAPLSIVKSGNGWSVLTLDNDYTGTTRVTGGILQVGRNQIGDTGGPNSLGTIVENGGTIAGTGWIMGGPNPYDLDALAGSKVSPGDLAGRELGTLNISGDAIFRAGSEALLQVRTPTYRAPGATDASNPEYAAWIAGIPTSTYNNFLNDLVTTEQHDMINVTGNLTLVAGSKVTLINDGYAPSPGDVFHLFKAGTIGTNGVFGALNVGSVLRTGAETGTDLDLFDLGGHFRWDTSLLNSHGILTVVQLIGASSLPSAPEIAVQPTTSAVGVLQPGTTFTITCKADSITTTEPITMTLLKDGAVLDPQYYTVSLNPSNGIPSGNGVQATFTLTASSATEGTFSVRASNAGGTAVSNTVSVDVNVTPIVIVHPTDIPASLPSLPTGAPVDVQFMSRVEGPSPAYKATWYKLNGQDLVPVYGPVDAAPVLGQPGKFDTTFTITGVVEADQGRYLCRFTDADNANVYVDSNPALLNVLDPVSTVLLTRTRNPEPTYQGETIVFAVKGTGEGNLTYRWYKNGEEIPNQTESTLTVVNTTILATPDSYYCRVSNAVNGQESNVVTLPVLDPRPVIHSHTLAHRTVLVGDSLAMGVTAGGRPALTYQWFRNGSKLATGLGSSLSFNPITTANGGSYRCEVFHSYTTTRPKAPATGSVELVVVDGGTRVFATKNGAASFTLPSIVGKATATSISYKWYRRTVTQEEVEGEMVDVITDTPVPVGDARYAGAEATTATANSLRVGTTALPVSLTDDGLYFCRITGKDNVTVDGCFYDVRVYDEAPVNNTPNPLAHGVVGGPYTASIVMNAGVDEATARRRTPVSYSQTGLPEGLSLNASTGLISGRPTKAGLFRVTTWATNLIGQSLKVTSDLRIFSLPYGLPGSFAGPIARNQTVNKDLGGRFTMTVTSLGTFSGSLYLGSATKPRPFKGAFVMQVDPATGLLLASPSTVVTIPALGALPTVKLEFKLDITAPTNPGEPPLVYLSTDSKVLLGSGEAAMTGWRKNWATTAIPNNVMKPTAYTGRYNMAICLPDDSTLIGNKEVPQGSGYATFVVSSSGTYLASGRTPDGAAFTTSAFIGPEGELFIFKSLYATLTKGSILSDDVNTPVFDNIQIVKGTTSADNDISGVVSLFRPPHPATLSIARTYRSGFGHSILAPKVTLTNISTPVKYAVIGGRYIPPVAPKVIMNMNAATTAANAEFVFSEDGDLDNSPETPGDVRTRYNPDVQFRVKAKNVISMPLKKTSVPMVNPAGVRITTKTSTMVSLGSFKGTFTLSDPNPVPGQITPVIRTTAFQGLLIRVRDTLGNHVHFGTGYFIINQLPQNTITPFTSPTTSPKLSGMVTLKPVGATVDPH